MYRFKVRDTSLKHWAWGHCHCWEWVLSSYRSDLGSHWIDTIREAKPHLILFLSPGGTFLKIAIRLSLLLIKNNIIATKVTILFNYQIEILIFFGKPFYFFLRLPAVFPLSFGLFNRSVSNFYFSFSKSYCFIPNKILLTNCFDG